LSDQYIDEGGYRSLPASSRVGIVGEPAHRFPGLNPGSVPRFFRNRAGRWSLCGPPALAIPVRDARRRLVAWQLRPDRPRQGAKYVWLSSRGKGGASPGVRGHVPVWVEVPAPTVRIVEGPLKADICTLLSGLPTIGCPGVGLWRSCLPLLRALSC